MKLENILEINMKNFIFYGPLPESSTDGQIIFGASNILKNIMDEEYKITHISSEDFKEQDTELICSKIDFEPDYICLYSPFLWDNFYQSWKYKNMIKFRNKYPNAKLLMMGVGSCIPYDIIYDNNYILRKEQKEEIIKLYSNSINIVRDHILHNILSSLGIKSYHLICPSFFCYNEFPEPQNNNDNILIFIDLERCVSRGSFIGNSNKESRKMRIYDLMLDFYKQYKPKVYCNANHEIEVGKKLGFDNIELLKDRNHTLEIMKNANIVLSSRIHNAIPAFVQGKKVGLIPIDSRQFTLSDFGCDIIYDIEQIKLLKSEKRNFRKYLPEYKKIILGDKYGK